MWNPFDQKVDPEITRKIHNLLDDIEKLVRKAIPGLHNMPIQRSPGLYLMDPGGIGLSVNDSSFRQSIINVRSGIFSDSELEVFPDHEIYLHGRVLNDNERHNAKIYAFMQDILQGLSWCVSSLNEYRSSGAYPPDHELKTNEFTRRILSINQVDADEYISCIFGSGVAKTIWRTTRRPQPYPKRRSESVGSIKRIPIRLPSSCPLSHGHEYSMDIAELGDGCVLRTSRYSTTRQWEIVYNPRDKERFSNNPTYKDVGRRLSDWYQHPIFDRIDPVITDIHSAGEFAMLHINSWQLGKSVNFDGTDFDETNGMLMYADDILNIIKSHFTYDGEKAASKWVDW